MRRALWTLTALTAVAALVPSAVVAQPPATATIDFSTAPKAGDGEPFPKDFYAEQGIVFTESLNVGYLQGDDALSGAPTIAARFTVPVTRLSLEAAPDYQGTAEYTLAALDQAGQVVATKVVVVTQDEGDPANQGFGYFPIDLGRLSRAAVSFTLRLRFIRSSYGTPECSPPGPPETCFSYGVRTITFTPGPTRKKQCEKRRWLQYGVFESRRECVRFAMSRGQTPA